MKCLISMFCFATDYRYFYLHMSILLYFVVEPEGVLHRSRAQPYAIPSPKGQTHVLPTPKKFNSSISSKDSTFAPQNSPDRKLAFEPDVADGIPESMVECGVEADSANLLGSVKASSDSAVEAAEADGKSPEGLFFHDGFLSFTSRDCLVLPLDILANYAPRTKKLDVSFNCLVNVKGLEAFVDLEELMLDNNDLTDEINFPNLPKLRTLSINKNKVSDA